MLDIASKWKPYLAGETLSPESLNRIERYWSTLSPGEDRLWPDLPPAEDASDLRDAAVRLRELTAGLRTPGMAACRADEALKRQLNDALEWVAERRYVVRERPAGNWWHWEIGAPLALLETIILLGEDADRKATARLARAIGYYVADPSCHALRFGAKTVPSTGANLVWKVTVAALLAAIVEDEIGLRAARDALLPLFRYADEGDGFYEDGSFIQHDRFAYTGGYGVSLLHDLVRLQTWLHGTPWQLPPETTEMTRRWIVDSFVSLMFRGSLFDMARGREIARADSQNHESGHVLVTSCLRFARMLEPERAKPLLSAAKSWIQGDTYKSYADGAPPDAAELAERLLTDERIPPAAEEPYCRLFAAMDRAVLGGPGFAYTVSMRSRRTASYEACNGENWHGWHTAQGMTALYDADLGQYADGFWPTVDPYRLAGTTATAGRLREWEAERALSARGFAGGAVLEGRYGAIGMELEDLPREGAGHPSREDNPMARKSWFLFGDRILALGSNVTHAGTDPVVTVIENRMLPRDGGYRIQADGERMFAGTATRTTVRPRWLHLSGTSPEFEVGYVLPEGGEVQAQLEQREGAWRDIHRSGTAERLRRDYLTLWYDHGTAPVEAGYAYATLPGRSAAETAAFAALPPLRVVERSERCHAAEDEELGLFAAHFWQPEPHACGPMFCGGRATVVLRRAGRGWSLAVSDPTQAQTRPIELKIRLAPGALARRHERLKLLESGDDAVRLLFDPAGAMGRSFEIAFETEDAPAPNE